MAKLKVALVGTGNIAHAHIEPWIKHADAEVVALCDIKTEKAQAFATKYKLDVEVFADYRELLEKADVDIVDICTPNLYHSEIAVAALKADKHVLCEKPDAISIAEAEKMKAAADESSRLLMTIRNNRFSEQQQFMKRYIQEGNMGEIYHARCGWIRRRGIPGKGGWFTTKALSGGGPLIDLGVHMIDLAMWLMGNPRPVTVTGATYCKFAETELSDSVDSAFGEKKAGGTFDVEDLAAGFIRFENGATLSIEFSWASNIENGLKYYELRGTKAGASFNGTDVKLFSEVSGKLIDVQPRLSNKGGHAEQINHFVNCVLGKAKPIVIPEQGLNMIKILESLYLSAKTGAEVKL